MNRKQGMYMCVHVCGGGGQRSKKNNNQEVKWSHKQGSTNSWGSLWGTRDGGRGVGLYFSLTQHGGMWCLFPRRQKSVTEAFIEQQLSQADKASLRRSWLVCGINPHKPHGNNEAACSVTSQGSSGHNRAMTPNVHFVHDDVQHVDQWHGASCTRQRNLSG